MAARAIWKGTLHLDDLRLGVKLYSAVEDRRVHLRLLHAEDHVPVRQVMVNPETDEAVPRERVRKGYEVDRGVFVLLEEDELEELEPEPSRSLDLERFVPEGAVGHRWYDRPYWLGPDGDPQGYFALVDALAQEKRVGIAHWVMRGKEYAGALRSDGEHLMLITLRHAEELISAAGLERPAGREPDETELQMAEKLVDALSGEPELEAWGGSYDQRLLELIEQKAEGGEVVLRGPEPEKGRAASLGEALEASLQKIREEKRSA